MRLLEPVDTWSLVHRATVLRATMCSQFLDSQSWCPGRSRIAYCHRSFVPKLNLTLD